MCTHPEVFVLAGPNGAGKTTVAELLLPRTLGVSRFVNADYIAKALSPYGPESSGIAAGRVMLARMREFLNRRETFAFESTLASRSFAPFLRNASAQGYVVHVIYVSLESADLALRRVRLRVERGGHDIPEATVRRRYRRRIMNLFQLYQPLADGWSVWDNSGDDLVPVARHRAGGGEPVVFDARRWALLSAQGVLDAG